MVAMEDQHGRMKFGAVETRYGKESTFAFGTIHENSINFGAINRALGPEMESKICDRGVELGWWSPSFRGLSG